MTQTPHYKSAAFQGFWHGHCYARRARTIY